MSSKASFGLLLRLAVLLAAFLAQSGEGATYQDFLNSHVDYPKTYASNPNAYCNLMMQQRGMTTGTCKTQNTFINDPPTDIQDICQGRGSWWKSNLFNSTLPFNLVYCYTTGHYPNCNYAGLALTRRICVACNRNGLPVHFERIL